MPRYIEVQTALNIIDKYAKTVTENEKVIVDAVRDIVEIITPAANVVPKSEVENWKAEANRYQTWWSQSYDEFEVSEAKTELAKEIFEEIEKIIDEKYNRFIFKDQPYDSDEEIDAIINYSDSVSYAIAELKKKYTEGE